MVGESAMGKGTSSRRPSASKREGSCGRPWAVVLAREGPMAVAGMADCQMMAAGEELLVAPRASLF
jgi:hypothetical protein